MAFRFDTYTKKVSFVCVKCEEPIMVDYCRECWEVCTYCELFYDKGDVNEDGRCYECEKFHQEEERCFLRFMLEKQPDVD